MNPAGRLLSRMSIRKKLLLTCVLGLIVACAALSSVLILRSYSATLENTVSQSRGLLEQTTANLASRLRVQRSALESLKDYTPLKTYLNASYPSTYEQYLSFIDRVYPGLQMIMTANSELRIRVYSDNLFTSFSSVTARSLAQLYESDWFPPDRSRAYGDAWATTADYPGIRAQRALVCYLPLYEIDAPAQLNYVVAVFQSEEALARALNCEEGAVTLLLDEKGDLVASSALWSEEDFHNHLGPALPPDGERIEIKGQPFLLIREFLNEPGLSLYDWQVVSLIPYGRVTEEAHAMIVGSIFITLMVLGLMLFPVLRVAGNITGRLNCLMDRIDAAYSGHSDCAEPIFGSDEIARISDRFDSMVSRTERLIEDNERIHGQLLERNRAEQEIIIRQREAELQALRAQINPHFLFNTLETIRMNLLVQGDRETAHVMLLFAESIRQYMSPARSLAVLEDELVFMKHYIFIQKYRFGDRLSFEERIDPSLYEQMIPRLILQPVIENAIHHGVERKVGPGRVLLTAWLAGARLYLQVEDDGAGMDARELQALHAHIESAAPRDGAGATQMGLRNVARRIRLLYGEEYGLAIESEKGAGTRVTITLAAKRGD